MDDRQGSLCGSFEEERARLEPIFRTAEERHRGYQRVRRPAFEEGTWDAFKDTEERKTLQHSFLEAQKPVEEAGQRIVLYLHANPQIVPAALAYLSIRARPFRSGYFSQRMLRGLGKFDLSVQDLQRLRKIVLDRLTWPWAQPRDLFRWFPRLRTPALESALEVLTDDPRSWVCRRAAKALAFLGRKPEAGSRKPGKGRRSSDS